MQPQDVYHTTTRPPVLAGAAAQAVVLATYLRWVAYEPPGFVMLLGLAGGIVAGLVVDAPRDAWIDGSLASGLGFLVWSVAHLGHGGYLAAEFGTDTLLIQHLLFVTSLSLWALPAYIVLGAIAAPLVAYPLAATRRRLRSAADDGG